MAPRILTFEEQVNEKSVELVKLKLKFRSISKEERELYELIIYLEELSYKFIEKIVAVRYNNPASPRISQQIREFQNEVESLEERVKNLNDDLQHLRRKKMMVEGELKNFEENFKNFVSTNNPAI